MYCWLRLKAGTGKSTLVKFIISALNLNQEDVAYVAFTGKAANVLTQKGCPNATTAHKLLYHARQLPNGKFTFAPKKVLEHRYKLIVVDEISMLPIQMWELLLKHKIYILVCGDPAQLSPIDKDADNHVLDHPHIFLDEIMRQAQESEIIRLSMDIRAGNPLPKHYNGNEVIIIPEKELVSGMYDWADQIICATNNKRNTINFDIRSLKGYSTEPQIGDKVIALRNYWDIVSENSELALTNGTIGTLQSFELGMRTPPIYIADSAYNILNSTISTDENDTFTDLEIDYKFFTSGQKSLTPQQEFLLRKNKNINFGPPMEFAYAYAITCWKAQGSEWNKILLFEEKFPFDINEHKRYLYTGLTRAKEKIVIVKKEN